MGDARQTRDGTARMDRDPKAQPAERSAAGESKKTEPSKPAAPSARPPEFGGPSGLEPTRYGDWERNGRVSDF